MNIGVGEALLIALCGFVTVFLLLLFLILVITVISRIIITIEGKGKQAAPAASAAPATPAAPAPAKEEKPSKPWDGKLQLIDCDEETAACLMAIISDETDIPLDELQFRRIQAL